MKHLLVFYSYVFVATYFTVDGQHEISRTSTHPPFGLVPVAPFPITAPDPRPQSNIKSYSVSTDYGMEQDLDHECVRECVPNTRKKKCRYEFHVEWYVSMSKACYSCPFNLTDCLRPHCVPTDGFERPLVTVNRRLPGPAIHVCEGDEIIVDVRNDLMSDSTSIHWHGLHQAGNQYMDGVPFLTQCPIQPGTTFRYHILADLPGTHYWHSHSGFQRTDGMFGGLVIRAKNDPHKDLYDEDDPRFNIVLTDWMDKLGVDKFVNHHHTEHENKPYNILVNGIGIHKSLKSKDGSTEAFTPIYEFNVRKGMKYRFRSVSNSIQNCPIEISIDNHPLLMIASDAHSIEPKQVESFVIYGGERWDFVLDANMTRGVYWMKFRGLLDCDERFKSAYQVAVIRYDDSEGLPQNLEDLHYDSARRGGLQLNKLNAAPGDLITFLTAADVRNIEEPKDSDVYRGKPKYQFWLDYDFYSKDNDLFHHEDFYPFFGIEKGRRLFMPQINDISLKLPNAPPLSQPDDVDQDMFCNSTNRQNCDEKFCHCSHTLDVELGSLVEVILIDRGVVYWANHPFHLHGHAFAVMGMGRLGENTTLKAVKELEAAGKLERNFDHPPIKDTVTVPDGGYTVIRFVATNPGYWLFHCHITFHIEVGMGLIFKVGTRDHIPPVPRNFPTCKSWLPELMDDFEERVSLWSNASIISEFQNHRPYPYYSCMEDDAKCDSRNVATSFKNSSIRVLIIMFLVFYINKDVFV